MRIYTKESLISELLNISSLGWIQSRRAGNQGSIGNTLEDLLGIEENNLPIPNANEWELKTQRLNTSSLTTLFHIEPSPRAIRFVPNVLLPLYGWKHTEAGQRHPADEKSFRQTINGQSRSDRGFMVQLDNINERVVISFDKNSVDMRHSEWLQNVLKNTDGGELNPQPYWGYLDLSNKAGVKLLNCFYIEAEARNNNGYEEFKYSRITMLQEFSFTGFLEQIKEANILVDFDARTGHNHGTKFRMRKNAIINLYKNVTRIL
jgi:hypothetical protein